MSILILFRDGVAKCPYDPITLGHDGTVARQTQVEAATPRFVCLAPATIATELKAAQRTAAPCRNRYPRLRIYAREPMPHRIRRALLPPGWPWRRFWRPARRWRRRSRRAIPSRLLILIGSVTTTAEFGEADYTIAMTGNAGGVLRVVSSGEGTMSTTGTVQDGRSCHATARALPPTTTPPDVTMTFEDGDVGAAGVGPAARWRPRGADRGTPPPVLDLLIPARPGARERHQRRRLRPHRAGVRRPPLLRSQAQLRVER